MASQTSAASLGPNGVDFVKDTYIPIFTNRPGDYKEWRKRILLYKKKSDLNKKSREATINLMPSLSGIAWRQIEHLVDKASEAEDGFTLILKELDKTFQYDDQVEMPRAFEKFFYGVSRRDGQTLINYVADHREYLMEVEKHGVKIPDKVSGWLLLRRAGLTMEQKQLVQGRAKDMDLNGVTEALYFLFGQDYKGKTNDGRNWRGKGYGSTSRWGRQQGYVTEEIYEAEDDEVPDEPYNYEGDDWDDYGEDDYGDADGDDAYYTGSPDEEPHDEFFMEAEQQYEDAYATYLDARRQMAHLKASRGFYPVVALADGAAAASPTSQSPRPPKSKGKGKNKKGRGKWQSKTGTIVSRGQAASKCLKCGQPGHWAASCPQNTARSSPTSRQSPSSATSTSPSKKSRTDGSAMMVRDMAKVSSRGLPAIGQHGWYGIQDGGASSVVVGHVTLMHVVDYMKYRGVRPDRFLFMATNKTFSFGGDTSRQADWSVRLRSTSTARAATWSASWWMAPRHCWLDGLSYRR